MKYSEYLATLKPAQRKVANRAFAFGEQSGLEIACEMVQCACPLDKSLHEEGWPAGCIHCGWAVKAIIEGDSKGATP